jgi:hypothetical protein
VLRLSEARLRQASEPPQVAYTHSGSRIPMHCQTDWQRAPGSREPPVAGVSTDSMAGLPFFLRPILIYRHQSKLRSVNYGNSY